MPRRLLLALILLVAAPLVLLGWLSASSVRENRQQAESRLARLLSSQLADADRQVSGLFQRYAADLQGELVSSTETIETLKRLRREHPIVRQGMYVNGDGKLVFPTAKDLNGADASEVAAALPGLIDARPLRSSGSESARSETTDPSAIRIVRFASEGAKASKRQPNSPPLRWDWQSWYMGDGAQVVYWQRAADDGSMIGVLLERSRWMSDIIALMPDATLDSQATEKTSPESATLTNLSLPNAASSGQTPIGHLALVDEARQPVYRWGQLGQVEQVLLVTRPLSSPLASWQFRLYTDPELLPQSSPWPIYLSLGSIGVLLCSVGGYVLTSVQREMSKAESRVSFAGQVSHELRTPLTNIRLYTELAEKDLERMADEQSKQALTKRLKVIDHETKRLQRLVSGVLEMIRPSKRCAGVRRIPTDPEALVDNVIEQFEPTFAAAEISLQRRMDCGGEIEIDPDVVELVLVNLLSNVEKYVPRGGHCRIACQVVRDSSGSPRRLCIVVDDDGPGIAAMHRVKVFAPFQRLDDSVNAPSGTGIGLTIARRAARRHGGDLVLATKHRSPGAKFELTIPLSTSAKT